MSDLKPCPFCGGEAYTKTSSPSTANHNEGAVHFAVSCGEFGCDVLPVANLWQCTLVDAAKAWNNRPHENKIKADAMRREIDYIKSNRPHWHLSVECEMMMDRLSKIEKGEL